LQDRIKLLYRSVPFLRQDWLDIRFL
jgi:hypothetical protein